MPVNNALPSTYHSQDHQAHGNTASWSGNTSRRVKGRIALLWLEASVKMSHLEQFASPYWLLSCSNGIHQVSQNPGNSVRGGHCLMVSLWMLRYYMKHGGYSTSVLPNQYWYSDPHWWDLHSPHPIGLLVSKLSHMSSHRWHSWMAHPPMAVLPLGLVQGLLWVLDALEVELSESLNSSGEQNSVTAIESTPILHQ